MSLLSDARDIQVRAEAWKRTQSTPYRALEWDTLEKTARVMPRIVTALEERESLIASLHRVWRKAQGSDRATHKQYVEAGDLVFHATNGEKGKCGGYSGPPCQETEA